MDNDENIEEYDIELNEEDGEGEGEGESSVDRLKKSASFFQDLRKDIKNEIENTDPGEGHEKPAANPDRRNSSSRSCRRIN